MQKHVNLVDLVKSFPTNIYLQNLASIQKRTSPVKFAHLAEKSGKGSISNLSTKLRTRVLEKRDELAREAGLERGLSRGGPLRKEALVRVGAGLVLEALHLRTPVNNIEYFPPNFEGLVLGCIDADFCK